MTTTDPKERFEALKKGIEEMRYGLYATYVEAPMPQPEFAAACKNIENLATTEAPYMHQAAYHLICVLYELGGDVLDHEQMKEVFGFEPTAEEKFAVFQANVLGTLEVINRQRKAEPYGPQNTNSGYAQCDCPACKAKRLSEVDQDASLLH